MLLGTGNDEGFTFVEKDKGGELKHQIFSGFLKHGEERQGKILAGQVNRRTDFQLMRMELADPVQSGERGYKKRGENGGNAGNVSRTSSGLRIHAVQM